MEEQIGTLVVLGALASVLAEQTFGALLHKNWMKLAVLAWCIAVSYMLKLVPSGTLPLDAPGLAPVPVAFVWAYGLAVYIVAVLGRDWMKDKVPSLAQPPINIGGTVAAILPGHGTDIQPSDSVPVGTFLVQKGTNNIATVTGVNTDGSLKVRMGDADYNSLPRSWFRKLNR